MKYLYLLSVFLLVLLGAANAQSDLLSRIDTNIVLNHNGKPLRYHQYIDLLKTGDYGIATIISADHMITKELKKHYPAYKKNMKMDKASIEKSIARMFGIQEDLPLSDVDTTIVVYNTDGKPLAYHQYAPLILSKKFNMLNEKGKRYLKPRIPIMQNMALIAGTDTAMLKALNLTFSDSYGYSANNSLYWGLMRADRIRVEKSKRKLYIERNGKILHEFPINLGNHPVGHKQKEGDGRTPEGSYFIDYNINSKAAYKLGLHISYPNEQDLLTAKKLGVKPGGDVMIHGTSPERANRKDWTNGCIAISNEHLDILASYYYNSIPIQINK